LESADHAHQRGAAALGRILGTGVSGSDCPTYRWPDDPGEYVNCMRNVLGRSGLDLHAVGAVMASANGNRTLDRTEARALAELFESTEQGMPVVTAIKSMLGESGAGGVAQVMTAVEVLKRGTVPPTISGPQEASEAVVNLALDKPKPIDTSLDAVLVNSFASGGSNVSVMVSR